MADGLELAIVIVSGGALALLGAIAGYLLSLRTARKQRLHEVKQEAYGRMFPIIEESVFLMGQIHELQELSFPRDEEFKGYLARLFAPLFALGDWDTMRDLDEIEADTETKKGRLELLETARNYLMTRLIMELYSGRRELRHEFAGLSMVPPGSTVQAKLNAVTSMLTEEDLNFGLRTLMKSAGMGAALASVSLRDRGAAYENALKELKAAMTEELRQTL